MGQIKKLLDNLFEIEETFCNEDIELNYELWVAQKEAEQAAYEEMLSDINK